MAQFKKPYNLKIVVLTVSILALFTNIVYSYSSKDSLRVPVGQKGLYNSIEGAMREEGFYDPDRLVERLEKFLEAIIIGKYQRDAIIDLTKLPQDKEVILVGDLHARLDNLKKILAHNDNLGKIQRGEAVLVTLGDIVHSETNLREMDSSVEIMQYVMELKIQNEDNVYCALGDHDYISDSIGKVDIDGTIVEQSRLYREKLLKLADDRADEYISLYEDFIETSPLIVIANGVVATHAGPIVEARLKEIEFVDVLDEDNFIVEQAIYNSFARGHYNQSNIDECLEVTGQPKGILIVSHSPKRDGNWYWQLTHNHYIIFAGHDRVGYAVVKNGVVELIEINSIDTILPDTEALDNREVKKNI